MFNNITHSVDFLVPSKNNSYQILYENLINDHFLICILSFEWLQDVVLVQDFEAIGTEFQDI